MICNAVLRNTQLTDITEARALVGFCVLWLNPDESHSDGPTGTLLTHLQDLMGETSENRTKLSTSITVATKLSSLSGIITLAANAIHIVDYFTEDDECVLRTALKSILKSMVHPNTRNQARSAVPDEIPHLYHFFYSAIEAVWVALVNFGFNNNNVNLFATGQSHLIDTAPLDRLLATTAINVASIDAFGTGSNVPQPRLYFNSHEHVAAKKAERDKLMAELGLNIPSSSNRGTKRK